MFEQAVSAHRKKNRPGKGKPRYQPDEFTPLFEEWVELEAN